MPVCKVCDGTEFEVENGLYYCTECSTQTQEIQEEVRDEGACAAEINFQASLFVQTKTKSPRVKEKKVPNLGVTWTTHEAYNAIICEQVRTLIKMGASPKLKDVVLQLWAFYLQKNEIAFKGECDDSGDWEPRLGAFPRKRDVQVLTGETEICYRKVSVKKKAKRQKKEASKIKEEEADAGNDVQGDTVEDSIGMELDTAKVVEENVAMQVDTVEGIVGNQVETTDGNDEKQPGEAAYKKKKTSELKHSRLAKRLQKEKGKKALKRKPCNEKEMYSDFMSLPKTLCFSYLGLLLMNEEILLCDIIRFTKEGHLPYMDATHHLPSSMQLQDSDWAVFTPALPPNMKKMVSLSTQMAIFLGLSEIPCRPLLPIAVRFIKDLALPVELITVVKNLLEEHPCQRPWIPFQQSRVNKTNIPMYEVEAMAHVLVALKLVFGLDGREERKLSKFALEKNKQDNKLNFFVWDEWFSSTKLKEEFLRSRNIPYSHLHEGVLDVELIRTNYFDVLQSWTHKACVAKTNYKYYSPQYRKEMKKVFSEMLSSSNNYNKLVCSASSFPLQSRLCQQMSLLNESHQYSLSQPDSGLLLKNMSSCSLSFIFNYWHHYIQDRAVDCKAKRKRRLSKQKTSLEDTLNSVDVLDNNCTTARSFEHEKTESSLIDKSSADGTGDQESNVKLPKKRKRDGDCLSKKSKRKKVGKELLESKKSKSSKVKKQKKRKVKEKETSTNCESENLAEQEKDKSDVENSRTENKDRNCSLENSEVDKSKRGKTPKKTKKSQKTSMEDTLNSVDVLGSNCTAAKSFEHDKTESSLIDKSSADGTGDQENNVKLPKKRKRDGDCLSKKSKRKKVGKELLESKKSKSSKVKKHKKKKLKEKETYESENLAEQEKDKSDVENSRTENKDRNCSLENSKVDKSKRGKTPKTTKKSHKVKKSVKKKEGKHHKHLTSFDLKGKSQVFSKNYWYVNLPFNRIQQAFDNLPESFKWLLNFTSEIVETSVDILYCEVLVIERRLYKRKLKSK